MKLFPAFGKMPAGPRLERLRKSAHYSNETVQNPEPTDVSLQDAGFFKMLKEFMNKPKDNVPPHPIPTVRTDLKALPSQGIQLVWFGHSSYLLKMEGMHLLVDPVFSPNAAPVSFFAKAFAGTDAYGTEQLPDFIEMVVLTHDHYDHLDYRTILRLKNRVGHFYTSLGVGSHLESWGIPAEQITELDWWESTRFGSDGKPDTAAGGMLTATPARHFSGRNFKRNTTVWSSFVLEFGKSKIFLGGDSGYGEHFRQIGERFGPFDLAILECGQYGVHWPYIHMFPEQTAQAALDLEARQLLPVHWAKFSLALHPWNEPIRRLKIAAEKAGVPLVTPRIGEVIELGKPFKSKAWWEEGA